MASRAVARHAESSSAALKSRAGISKLQNVGSFCCTLRLTSKAVHKQWLRRLLRNTSKLRQVPALWTKAAVFR